MPLFSFVFPQLFGCLTHFLCKREKQQCTAQEEKLPEPQLTTEAFTYVYNDRKCKKRCRKVPKSGVKMEKDLKPERVTARSCFLTPIEGDLPELPSISGHLIIPAMNYKHLPPVKTPSESPQSATEDPNEGFPCSVIQVAPCLTSLSNQAFPFQPSSSPVDPMVSPTPSSVEVVLRPQSSQIALESDLIIVDFENVETEHVEQSIGSCGLLKSEHSQMLEAEMSPMAAWMEVTLQKKEAWASQELEVKRGEFEDTTQKKEAEDLIEKIIKLFRVTSPDGPKNKTKSNVKAPKGKRKLLFRWIEEKFKKKEKMRTKDAATQSETNAFLCFFTFIYLKGTALIN